jgi:hypothetical protein
MGLAEKDIQGGGDSDEDLRYRGAGYAVESSLEGGLIVGWTGEAARGTVPRAAPFPNYAEEEVKGVNR